MNELILITNTRDNPDGSRFGFGITAKGEGVYIPVGSMGMAGNVDRGDQVSAVLMPNENNHNGHTPWFCTAILPEAPESAPKATQKAVSAQDVLDHLNGLDCAVTASDVAEDLGITKERASTTLVNLHTAAEISRIALYRKQGSTKATIAAYVSNAKAVYVFNAMLGEAE